MDDGPWWGGGRQGGRLRSVRVQTGWRDGAEVGDRDETPRRQPLHKVATSPPEAPAVELCVDTRPALTMRPDVLALARPFGPSARPPPSKLLILPAPALFLFTTASFTKLRNGRLPLLFMNEPVFALRVEESQAHGWAPDLENSFRVY